VIRLRSIGDIVLLTPSLRLLKQWRPDLQVSVLIESRFRELLTGNSCVDEVLSPRETGGWRELTAPILTARGLRKRKFSLCVNLHGGPRSAFLSRYCGATWKAGFAHFRSRTVYDLAIPDAREILGQPLIHTAEHQAAAFFWLGLPRQPIPGSELFPSEAGKAEWNNHLKALGIDSGADYAIIQPTALYFTKEWPPEHFAKVGDHIERSSGIIPIFSCGPGESGRLDEVERALHKPVRRVQDLSLRSFIAALNGARLFLGNDSGPAHMAAALGRPVVVVFGSSSSRIWGPWLGTNDSLSVTGNGPGSAFRVVQNSYECNPCRGDRCYQFERPQCILSVSFEQVRSAIESVLAEAPGVAANGR
jgi:heptosyltransferase III